MMAGSQVMSGLFCTPPMAARPGRRRSHSKDGLTLSDLHIENRVGWAIGKYVDGRQTVVAANTGEVAPGSEGWRELPHHVGPWYFLLGIPALLLSGFVLLRAWHSDPPPPEGFNRGGRHLRRAVTLERA